MSRPRVLLADDHRLLREAFAQILESGCDVVGAVGDGCAAVEAAVALRPDVVVLDVAMPVLNGIDACREIKRVAPAIRIIFLTVNEDSDLTAEAFRAGASGFLLKNSAASELRQAIQDVSAGLVYVTPQATKGLVAVLQQASVSAVKSPEVSERQREVLTLLAEGRTMKEIARALRITPRTVAFHKYALMRALGIKSNAELIQYAVRHGMAAPERPVSG